MAAAVDSPASPFRRNPVFWIMWLLPGAAVVAGLATLAIALRDADPVLPANYHWEGEHLERDFALARNAAAHGIAVSFNAPAAGGACTATLRNAPQDAAALNLLFASGMDPGLDRAILLQRVAPGEYRGQCAPLPPGRWRVALEDAAGTWAIRSEISGSAARLELHARDPAGAAP
jgi:uncharacterized protein